MNEFVEEYLTQLGVEVTWVPNSSVESYQKAVRENTKVRHNYYARKLLSLIVNNFFLLNIGVVL